MEDKAKKSMNLLSMVFAGFLFLSVIIFLIIGRAVYSESHLQMDESFRKQLLTFAGDSASGFFTFITEFGSKTIIGLGTLLVLAFLWFRSKNYLAMAAMVLAVAGGDQINKLVKRFIARERPSILADVDGVGFSFPSGHAMVGFIFYFVTAYFLTKYCRSQGLKILIWAAAFIMILLVGLSRIYLNVHYPSDVLGGYALGFIVIAVLLHFYEMVFEYMKNRKQIQDNSEKTA
ncbi:phosphatase PAP2 family protein [Peribacillus deserti]|uniref:Phosphatidic acid phosphatase type 2/haloperoxidase domain-containing protein n=1 Tax=Peribacillus deserti TaxID=673318 RepID=A0A2N5MA71_9BACI|nr:phosphatase PAP2 family protein [Peribacillus deserti]PLT31217.1 hypothetical protein CUU66_03305 [Peribacillus deserti]